MPQPVISASTPPWKPLTRVVFRLSFCYLLLFALCCGNSTAWEMIPAVGLSLEGLAAAPFKHAALFAGQHWFHLQGVAAHLHPSGYGDRALDWIAALLMLIIAIVATILWSLLDRRRTEYNTLLAWLRFVLRLSLAAGMLVYGVMKVFPFQIPPPSLAILNEPLGSVSPLTLLWSTLGFSLLYQRLCGCVEVLSALLLLWRRTALAGTLLALVVISNIVLFDFFFDVPVKLYAANLLLMSLALLAPDARALWAFFFTHQPATANSPWIPPVRGRALRAVFCAEILTLLLGLVFLPLHDEPHAARQAAAAAHPSPLTGEWRLDAALLNGQPQPWPTGDGQPLANLFLEPSGRVTGQAIDRTLWPGATYNDAHHSITVMNAARYPVPYTITQPDPSHLLLEPAHPNSPVLHLTRVPLPDHYSLYERGFHLTNEWGYER